MLTSIFGNLFGKSDFSLFELGKGYSFKYNDVVWEILEVHNYKWRDDVRTTEYKVVGYNQEAYLEVEKEDGEIYCSFSKEIKQESISPNIKESDFVGEDILGELDYNGKRYTLEEIDEGEYNNISNPEPDKNLITYTFNNGDYFVCIEQWEDGTLEFFAGEEIAKKRITNIKKGN